MAIPAEEDNRHAAMVTEILHEEGMVNEIAPWQGAIPFIF